MENDRSYFMRRAAEERSAADNASDGAARDAHLEMARRYRNLLSDLHSSQTADPTTPEPRPLAS